VKRKAELLAALRGQTACDAAVWEVGEADYGCEECAEDGPEKVWVLLVTRDGAERSVELPAGRLGDLVPGDLCRLADLLG
jgi:hypothetical protein